MLNIGIENLKDGMKVVVEDMDSILFGDAVGRSGEILEIKRGADGIHLDSWFLVNDRLPGQYMAITSNEYKHVHVLPEKLIEPDEEDKSSLISRIDFNKCDKSVTRDGVVAYHVVIDLDKFNMREDFEEGFKESQESRGYVYLANTEVPNRGNFLLVFKDLEDVKDYSNGVSIFSFEWAYVKPVYLENVGEEVMKSNQVYQVGDKVVVIAENSKSSFLGDHEIPEGTVVTVVGYDESDDSYHVSYGSWWKWAEPSVLVRAEVDQEDTNVIDKYPEGTKMRCTESLSFYEEGRVYTVGWCDTDEDTDYGVRDADGHVMPRGCMYSKGGYNEVLFDPTQWEVVEDSLEEDTDWREEFPEGTLVQCLSDEFDFYELGGIYMVGEDNDGDYGVKDAEGDVMWDGRMISGYDMFKGSPRAGFKREYWKKVHVVTASASTDSPTGAFAKELAEFRAELDALKNSVDALKSLVYSGIV